MQFAYTDIQSLRVEQEHMFLWSPIIIFTFRNYSSWCYSEENFGGNQLLRSSISLSLLYSGHSSELHVNTDFSPPVQFPVPSACPRIDHYVSGPIKLAQTSIK